MKNKTNFIGYWELSPSRLICLFPQLTEEQLSYTIGNEDELINRLAELLNKDYDEIMKIVTSFNARK